MSVEATPGKLYLIPNLLDPEGHPEAVLPAAALERVRGLRRFIVEGEKAAWRLLSRVLDREQASLVSMDRLDEHTSIEDLPALLAPVLAGEDAGLLSEAGVPCVADPGAALVALAHARGVAVTPLSGPSSIILALSASGLDGQRFSFLGYLPQDPAGRRKALAEIDAGVRADGATRIFIETPYRNAALLADCVAGLSPRTGLCVAASLTASSERVRSATVSEWRDSAWPLGKEPAIFLVGRFADDRGRFADDRGRFADDRGAVISGARAAAQTRPSLTYPRRPRHSSGVCKK
jgi:16S rRNA (cytidine1402-2'-O)-methyltransferase